MSTRGCFGVRINGIDKLMYNHSDSYPGGLGVEVVEAINSILKEKGKDWLKERAAALQMVDSNAIPTQEQIDLLKPYTGISERLDEHDLYCLMRNMQGNLKAHLEAGIGCDSSGFIRDSLFCEWAYVVNLDDNKLEIYKGFQRERHDKGRYSSLAPCCDYRPKPYYPCALVAELPLDDLPASPKQFNDLIRKLEIQDIEP